MLLLTFYVIFFFLFRFTILNKKLFEKQVFLTEKNFFKKGIEEKKYAKKLEKF